MTNPRRSLNRKSRTVEEDYIYWLLDQVTGSKWNKEYTNLFIILNSVKYLDDFGNDRNRSVEGEKLREIYKEESSYIWNSSDYAKIDWCSCTFLEMMIALAGRLEELTYNPYEDGDTSRARWFWEMISNLKFDTYDDQWFEEHFEEGDYFKELNNIHKTLENVNKRIYSLRKKGRLFPLQKNNKKLSQMELWDQANEYLIEKYPIE